MTTKIIEIYDVQRWDGGDRHNHECYVASEEEAQLYLGVDNKFDNFYKRTFVVHDTAQEAREYKDGAVKAQALAKLTEIERKSLGF